MLVHTISEYCTLHSEHSNIAYMSAGEAASRLLSVACIKLHIPNESIVDVSAARCVVRGCVVLS